MNGADKVRVEAFLSKWLGSEGNERANYQGFFLDLCGALGVEKPLPKGKVEGDPFCFEKDIKFYSGKKTAPSTRYADFYKADCFIIEAKQGSETSSKGHGKRGTKVYRDAMQKAFNQARAYAGMLVSRPPFLITCDIGSHFEVGEGFSGEYGSYGARRRVNLKDLAQAEEFDRFVKIFTEPQALNPEKMRARVTREVAVELAKLSRWLEEQGHEPQETASFLMRCIFTMFAEDVELLKGDVFTRALKERWIPEPRTFRVQIESLWRTMNTGGEFGFEKVLRFNGSFFEDATAFDLPKEQLEVLYAAAAKDWSLVEPAIFGTLVERALEKKERSRLGAHYTPRSYVERLVRPVVMEPLRQEWDEIELEIKRLLEPEEGKAESTATQRKKAEQEIRAFLDKLRETKILDPACGTGNFLYVSLDLLKGLEQEVVQRLVDVAGEVQLGFEQINPSQFLGIEINPRAAAIAELVIWIGYLQWYFKRFGNAEPPEPVLQAFDNIECRDAVLAYDGKEPDVDEKTGEVRTRWGGRMMTHPVTGEEVPDPENQVVIYRYLNARAAEWPEADYVVSNPPFIGNSRMRESLGDGYTTVIREVYKEVSETVDFVMYWWYKSSNQLRCSNLTAFGLITTNSISQVWQRKVIEKEINHKNPIQLFFAIPDHPWADSGAAVRIAMTAARFENDRSIVRFSKVGEIVKEVDSEIPENTAESIEIKYRAAGKIFANLQTGADISSVVALKSNQEICNRGVQLIGQGFSLTEKESRGIEPEAVYPYANGRDLLHNSRNVSVIDLFGISENKARSKYPKAYQWLYERVKPERDQNNRKSYRESWWLFGEPRANLRPTIKDLQRYIATVETAKHRTFLFLDKSVVPDNKIIVVALSDPYFLGLLSSTAHVTWALACGSQLGPTPVYPKTICFDPLSFSRFHTRSKTEDSRIRRSPRHPSQTSPSRPPRNHHHRHVQPARKTPRRRTLHRQGQRLQQQSPRLHPKTNPRRARPCRPRRLWLAPRHHQRTNPRKPCCPEWRSRRRRTQRPHPLAPPQVSKSRSGSRRNPTPTSHPRSSPHRRTHHRTRRTAKMAQTAQRTARRHPRPAAHHPRRMERQTNRRPVQRQHHPEKACRHYRKPRTP